MNTPVLAEQQKLNHQLCVDTWWRLEDLLRAVADRMYARES